MEKKTSSLPRGERWRALSPELNAYAERSRYPPVSDGTLESMSRIFQKVDYDRALDLTVRLGDCLPPDHLARFVVDSVAQLDLSALYAHYGAHGGKPYAPEVLLEDKSLILFHKSHVMLEWEARRIPSPTRNLPWGSRTGRRCRENMQGRE